MPFSTMIRKTEKDKDFSGKMIHANVADLLIRMFLRKEIAVIWKCSKLKTEKKIYF